MTAPLSNDLRLRVQSGKLDNLKIFTPVAVVPEGIKASLKAKSGVIE